MRLCLTVIRRFPECSFHECVCNATAAAAAAAAYWCDSVGVGVMSCVKVFATISSGKEDETNAATQQGNILYFARKTINPVYVDFYLKQI